MPIHFRSTPVSEPFTFESIGQDWEQDRVSRPAGFPFYHYLQTEKGGGRVETSAGSFLLRENEGVLIAPFVRHSYEKEGDCWFTKFATFTGTASSAVSQIVGSRQVSLITGSPCRRIAELIRDSMELYASRPADEKRISVNCYSMLLCFEEGLSSRRLADDPLYRNYVLPVIKDIERNYALPLTVEELSRKVFISPQYLSRLFRRYIGCSTYEYLTSFRIGKAKELLITNPGLEIQAAALRSGFSDPSHFTAVFKKNAGVTPLEFRRQN